MIRASVAMAVCNGEKYLSEQIDSIINMMNDDDELIISYNDSVDNTYKIIDEYQRHDQRVRIYKCEEKGVGINFNNALTHCKGKYVLFADQDDVWINDKINRCVEILENSSESIMIHNGYTVDNQLNKSNKDVFGNGKRYTDSLNIWIGGERCASYLGCCMAFKGECLNTVIPIPNNDQDVWTVNLLSRIGGIKVIEDKLILHRIHEANYSNYKRRLLAIAVMYRIGLLFMINKRIRESK